MHDDLVMYEADLIRLLDKVRGQDVPIIDCVFGFQNFSSKADLPELNEGTDSAIFHFVGRIVFSETIVDLGFGRHDYYDPELIFDPCVHWPSLNVYSVRPSSFLEAIGKSYHIPSNSEKQRTPDSPCWTASLALNYLTTNLVSFRSATKAQIDLMCEKFGERLIFDSERQKTLERTRDISIYVPLFHQRKYDTFLKNMIRYDNDPGAPEYLQKMINYARRSSS